MRAQYMGSKSMRWLRKQGRKHAVIVEVGVYRGDSLAALALHNTGSVTGVDTWAPMDDPEQAALYGDPEENYEAAQAAVGDRAELLRLSSEDGAKRIRGRQYKGAPEVDFVFIDADHREEAVAKDIEVWQKCIRPGGYIGGHDYGKAKYPGVKAAVDAAFGEENVRRGPGSIWWVQLP